MGPSWRRSTIAGALLFALLAATSSASAAKPELSLVGPLPFNVGELSRALSLRDLGAKGGLILVEALGADAVRICYEGARRPVALLGLRGAPAARRVALAILDLLETEVEVPLRPLAPLPQVFTASTGRTATVARSSTVVPAGGGALRAPRAPEETWARLALLATVGVGTSLERPAVGAAAGAGLTILGPLEGVLELGVSWTPPATIPQGQVTSTAFPLRAGLGWSLAPLHLQLRATALFTLLLLNAADGSTTASRVDWLFGGGVSAFWWIWDAGALQLLGGLGVDLATTRRQYQVHGADALATDRATAWLALGIAVGSRR